MIINGIEYKNVTIIDKNSGVCAIITDETIVQHDDYQVLFDVGENKEEM